MPLCLSLPPSPTPQAAAAPYAVPPFIRPLLAPPTRVLEISGIVEGEGGAAALEEDEERLRALEADVRTECRRFGRVKVRGWVGGGREACAFIETDGDDIVYDDIHHIPSPPPLPQSLHVARPNDPLRRAQEAAAAQAPAPAPLLLTGGAEPAFKPIPFVRSSEGPQAPDFPAAAEPGVGEGPPGGARGAEGEGADEPLPPLGKAWGLGKVYVEFMRPEVCAEVRPGGGGHASAPHPSMAPDPHDPPHPLSTPHCCRSRTTCTGGRSRAGR